MKFTFDPSVQALYIEVAQGEVARTVELREDVYADLDADSKVLGIEMLDLRAILGNSLTPVELSVPDRYVATD